jgi:hypothetical protein
MNNMTDYNIEKSYNEYMGRKKHFWQEVARLWQGLYLRIEPHFLDIFKAGYIAGREESPWVEMKDIPEEWKDGRSVDFAIYVDPEDVANGHPNSYRVIDCFFCPDEGVWQTTDYEILNTSGLTHAMIPTKTPKG